MDSTNNRPVGWYLKQPSDNVAHYWNGYEFTGDVSPRYNQSFPVFDSSIVNIKKKPKLGRTTNIILGSLAFLVVLMFVVISNTNNTKTIPATPSSMSNAEIAYVYTVRETHKEALATVDNALLIKTGHDICELLDAGGTIENVVTISIQSELPVEIAGTMTGAAIGAFCPQHTDLIEQYNPG